MLGDYLQDVRPVLLAVDGGADALLEVRLKPDMILGDMESVSDAKKALQGELGDTKQFDLGTICSFSIPIITICALLVLFIFLILLNIVFWWLPFIRICFPISLKAKG